MTGWRSVVLLVACAWLEAWASAAGQPLAYVHNPVRSSTTVEQFRRHAPCPATGLLRGACSGFVVDHLWPLCAGGRDAVANMAWEAAAQAKLKDLFEIAVCDHLRREVGGG